MAFCACANFLPQAQTKSTTRMRASSFHRKEFNCIRKDFLMAANVPKLPYSVVMQ